MWIYFPNCSQSNPFLRHFSWIMDWQPCKLMWVDSKENWPHFQIPSPPHSHLWSHLQGLSERMSKVKCLWKSQFSQNISFLNCFRSEISGKFMPHSIQVHQNHPKASLEAGASDVLSGCDRLFEADHWFWDSEKRPKIGVSVCEGQN